MLRELPDQTSDEPKYITNIRAAIEERAKILATAVQYGWEHSDLVATVDAKILGIPDVPLKPQIIYVKEKSNYRPNTRSRLAKTTFKPKNEKKE